MIIPPIGPVRLLLFSMRKCVTGNASPGDVIASHGAQGLMGSGVPIHILLHGWVSLRDYSAV